MRTFLSRDWDLRNIEKLLEIKSTDEYDWTPCGDDGECK